jgi:hypothetical protein
VKVESVKGLCDGAAAILALAAAFAWFRAASLPIARERSGMRFATEETNAKTHERNDCISMGAQWNKRAAFLTGLSALTMFVSWAVGLVGK